jgi:hypothetical protein
VLAVVELDFRVVLLVCAAVVVVAVLAFRLLNRDPGVRRTRFGVFVERDRYPDDEQEEEEVTRQWPRRDD